MRTEVSISAMFRGAFCDGAVQAVAEADHGSDANRIPPSVLKYIQAPDSSIPESKPYAPEYYGTVIKGGKQVIFSHKLECDFMVHMRHGANLMLRKMQCLVSDCETDFAIIGEPVLRALGSDNRPLLEAACDKFGGTVHVPELLEKLSSENQNRTTGNIHSLTWFTREQWGSTFHQGGGTKEDTLEDSDVYVDLGEHPIQELDVLLQERVAEAITAGMSGIGSKNLKDLLEKYKAVFE